MVRSDGFTLSEILVVLAVVGVLSAITYPEYASYVARTRRIEGQIALLESLQQQERFYSQNNTYIAFWSDASDPRARHFKWFSGATAHRSAYELRGQACPGQEIAQCVEVRAIPGTPSVDVHFKDADCETLTLDSAGRRGASGKSATCWP